MANLLRGKPVADAICEKLAPQIEACKERGITPSLGVIRVGDREDDLAYQTSLLKRFDALGLAAHIHCLPENCAQQELLVAIQEMNEDPDIHGILLFRPLPPHLDEEAACDAILPEKDVDGVTQGSLFGVFADRAVGFAPCTADACIEMLRYHGHELDGANVAVIGRSLVIGKPVSLMLQAQNATVTMCHTHTRELDAATKDADIIVVAAGHPNTLKRSGVREGQVIMDVGINWDAEANKLVGDVAFEEVEPVVSAITPVPGGIGSVTTAILAKHVVQAACR